MGKRKSRRKEHSLSWHNMGRLQSSKKAGESRLAQWVGSQFLVATVNISGRLGIHYIFIIYSRAGRPLVPKISTDVFHIFNSKPVA